MRVQVSHPAPCSCGETGKHRGLKIPRPKACGFDSLHEHQVENLKGLFNQNQGTVMAKNLRITITDTELAEILDYYRKLLKSYLYCRADYRIFNKEDSRNILKVTKRIQHLTRMHMKHCENE